MGSGFVSIAEFEPGTEAEGPLIRRSGGVVMDVREVARHVDYFPNEERGAHELHSAKRYLPVRE
jgi:hypothetical protein